ncbi:pyridoxal-phosphate dependent enzyme [Streptomyces sp. NPDC059452]|uniref:pyridoxal-phosphate dependent enzyme n=1 Tax=Streptomyces sp. NPDC059452 TaxID=3346835 RepID=UPI00368100E1
MTQEHPHVWAAEAIRRVGASGPQTPTPLRRLPLPALADIEVYLKDESAHPTGSMKYRLVRAMFREAIAGGAIGPGTPVIAATSGAVATAGAHFASLLGLDFTAVVPARTPGEALAGIERAGGRAVAGGGAAAGRGAGGGEGVGRAARWPLPRPFHRRGAGDGRVG